jgi:hypothetical protein
MECAKCHQDKAEWQMTQCPLCHEQACDSCKHTQQGRAFCSRHCAESYFFPDDEEGDAE